MEMPRSWVYFIQAGEDGPIKIGFSAMNPVHRLAALQTANAERLRLLVAVPGDRATEAAWHARFAESRMCGEWFRPTWELRFAIDMAAGGPENPRDAADAALSIGWAIEFEGLHYDGRIVAEDVMVARRLLRASDTERKTYGVTDTDLACARAVIREAQSRAAIRGA